MPLTIQTCIGKEILPFLDDLARLRIEIFKDFPYLYDGTMAYERVYLKTYSDCPDSFFVLARDPDDRIVGVSTSVPLEAEDDEFIQPFLNNGYDIDSVFYFGESVLKKAYRGQGVGVRFFQEREAFAKSRDRFRLSTFCSVDRPKDHPLRPPDYVPLDTFWRNRGYDKRPELVTAYSWKDIDEQEETEKEMVFWTKEI
jgi:GNAT superfamily N-acetyltransferase